MSADAANPYAPSDLGVWKVRVADAMTGDYLRCALGRPVIHALGLSVDDEAQLRFDPLDEDAVAVRVGTGGELMDYTVGRAVQVGPPVLDHLGAEACDEIVAIDEGDHVRLEARSPGGEE